MCQINIREASIRDVTFVLTAIILVVVIVFLYIKRYVERSRFQLPPVNGMPYTQNVAKVMVDEIEECLSIVASIRREPQLLLARAADLDGASPAPSDIVARMKTIDSMKQLDSALADVAPHLRRRPFNDVRRHLCDQRVTSGPLKLASLDVINDFVSLYEHARYDPGYYGQDKLDEYSELLKQLLYSVQSAGGATTFGHRSSVAAAASGSVAQPAPLEQERLLSMSTAARRPLLSDSGA